MAGSGKAMKDGSFPIVNRQDLKNAIKAVGRAKDPDKAKAHIKARAKALGAEGELPDAWKIVEAEGLSKFEPVARYDCGCADHKHLDKAEAVECMRKSALAAEVDKSLAPAREALAELMKTVTGEEPIEKAAPKAPPVEGDGNDASNAHEEAAKDHDGAADFHEQMAAKDGADADATRAHLAAAKAHGRAAEAHRAAADAHRTAPGSDGANDATEKAAHLTDHAANKSDGCFGKAEARGELNKFSADQDRDATGKWAAGIAASAGNKVKSVVTGLKHAAIVAGAITATHATGAAGNKIGSAIGAPFGHKETGGRVGELVGLATGAYLAGRAGGHVMARTEKTQKTDALDKGMYHVARLASMIEDLKYLCDCCDGEAQREGDGSAVPANLKSLASQLGQCLVDMTAEEVGELFTAEGNAELPEPAMAYAVAVTDLAKRDARFEPLAKLYDGVDPLLVELRKLGARNSSSDMDRLQKCHDLMKEMGASCASMDGKSAAIDDLRKDFEEREAMTKASLEDITKQLVAMKKLAAPAKAAIFAVTKDVDSGAQSGDKAGAEKVEEVLAKMTPEQVTELLMKDALRKPFSPSWG